MKGSRHGIRHLDDSHRRSKVGKSSKLEWYLSMLFLSTCILFLVQLRLYSTNLVAHEYDGNTVGHAVTKRNDFTTRSLGRRNIRSKSIESASALQLSPGNVCQKEYQRLTDDRLPGLTDEDMKRSKTYIGNRHRLAKLVEKLESAAATAASANTVIANGKTPEAPNPAKVAICGGSISKGHGVDVPFRYSRRLEDWMNSNYPLSGLGKHSVLNRGTHGADICAMAKRANLILQDLPPDLDMIILEFAVNDYQGQDHVTMIEDRTDVFFEGFQDIAVCTEAVVVKLLKAYPDAAIVFLEMKTAVIPRKSAALLHMGVAQHYQVPVISYEQALWPDYYRLVEELRPFNYSRPIDDTVLPFPHGCAPCVVDVMEELFQSDGCQSLCSHQRWSEGWLDCTTLPEGRDHCYVPFFAHDEVHPSANGHKIATDLIIDTIATTSLDLCQQKQERSPSKPPLLLESSRRDLLPSVGWMSNNPNILDAQFNFVWVNDTYDMFHETNENALHPLNHTEGFIYTDDRFNRWGWIATSDDGNEKIEFEIRFPEPEKGKDGDEEKSDGGEEKSDDGEEKSDGGEDTGDGGEEKRDGGEEKSDGGEGKSDGGEGKSDGGEEKSDGGDDTGDSGEGKSDGGDDTGDSGEGKSDGGDDTGDGGEDDNRGSGDDAMGNILDDQSCYIPYLSVLKSYENMGQMTVTVLDRKTKRETVVEIDLQWQPRISIPSDVQLLARENAHDEALEGCSGDCLISIVTKPRIEERIANKVKIITLSVRPCIPREFLVEHP